MGFYCVLPQRRLARFIIMALAVRRHMAISNCQWFWAQLAGSSYVLGLLDYLLKSGACIRRFAMMKGLAWITLLSYPCFLSALPACYCWLCARPTLWV